jgi:hypothetical protein
LKIQDFLNTGLMENMMAALYAIGEAELMKQAQQVVESDVRVSVAGNNAVESPAGIRHAPTV